MPEPRLSRLAPALLATLHDIGYIDRAVPLRILERSKRRVEIHHAGRRLSIPTYSSKGLSSWARYESGWKAQIIDRLYVNGTFVDVGANLGQTLLDYLSQPRPGPYVGFEPIPACAAFLSDIVTYNLLKACAIVPAALTGTPGVVVLRVPDGDLSSATMIEGLRSAGREQEIVVAATDFASAWDAVSGVRIGFVKIDVEGAELDVLAGMADQLRADRPTILCEVLRADPRADIRLYRRRISELSDLLDQLNYRVHRIVKPTGKIIGVERVNDFPLERWSPATAEDNDYLIVPGETRPSSLL